MSEFLSRSRRLAARILPLCLLVAAGSCAAAAGPPKGLDDLLKLEPAERMKLLGKVVDKEKDFVTATAGPLKGTVIARGSLESLDTSDIVYRVRPTGKNSNAAIIKWVIDEGSFVKKGDVVIEFDSVALAESLREQKELVAKAKAEKKRAADALERITTETRIDVKLAELERRLAEIALKQYKGKDPLQKETLAIQVEKAGLLVERAKLQAAPKIENASDILKAKDAALETEIDRQKEIEKNIAGCVVAAPRDGMVTYFLPENARTCFGVPDFDIVAQGEPVGEGQKLLTVHNLKRMAIRTSIPEGEIHKVRFGQKADVRVDAFPGRILAGKVDYVATVANPGDFFRGGKKLYTVVVAIDGEQKGDLKPGMSGEVAIVVGEQPKCLRLPNSAILGKGKDTFCYVRVGAELHVRKITIGLSDGKLTEIQSGLEENEPVLRSPAAVVARLTGE